MLEELYDKIIIPEFVFKESTKKGRRGAKAIKKWGEDKIYPVTDIRTKAALELTLNEGEAEVIALAQEIKADLVIIDEDKGRKIAKINNMNVTGTIGILLDAKQQSKISQIKPFLDKLIEEGIYISEKLYHKSLILAGEA